MRLAVTRGKVSYHSSNNILLDPDRGSCDTNKGLEIELPNRVGGHPRSITQIDPTDFVTASE